ncbi:larval cuticle protein 1-like [Anopheles ziemanni]|uniref:larval cuticle protein 1-like n=1 Tax=Anopheles coustani TaxID=139045 RepID=UPI0026596F99|nr:larval cuticle protein 1-like [Anopheles coustani]XP_058177971.1 larval cuticle protein 1-like [Anopheles ziemanni]
MRVVSLVVLCLMLFHAASLTAAPLGEERADLVRYENVQTENGYRFSFETKDGQIREEVGTIDVPTGVLKVSGRYSYRTPDGASYRVDFVADENGYRTIEQPNVAVQMYKTKDGQWRDETVEVDAATGKLVISGWYR